MFSNVFQYSPLTINQLPIRSQLTAQLGSCIQFIKFFFTDPDPCASKGTYTLLMMMTKPSKKGFSSDSDFLAFSDFFTFSDFLGITPK